MNRKTVTAAIVALAAMMGASAALAAASDAATGATAETAKKHKKKKKKKRKKGPVAPAPPKPQTPKPVDLFPCPGDDSFEPDDAQAQAFELPYPGSYEVKRDRFLCPGDTDYFKVSVPADGYFAVGVLAFEGIDPTITVYGAASPVVVDAGGYGAGESASIDNIGQPTPVTRWIGISANPADTGPYFVRGYET